MTLTYQFLGHLSGGKQHVLSHRCVEHPEIHREIVTKIDKRGNPVGES